MDTNVEVQNNITMIILSTGSQIGSHDNHLKFSKQLHCSRAQVYEIPNSFRNSRVVKIKCVFVGYLGTSCWPQ